MKATAGSARERRIGSICSSRTSANVASAPRAAADQAFRIAADGRGPIEDFRGLADALGFRGRYSRLVSLRPGIHHPHACSCETEAGHLPQTFGESVHFQGLQDWNDLNDLPATALGVLLSVDGRGGAHMLDYERRQAIKPFVLFLPIRFDRRRVQFHIELDRHSLL